MSRERAPWWHAVLVLAACAAVYWLGLGSRPFASSEGHRVVPGWTMLETGEWWRVTMFEQGYLRKPPGMPWAIGGMSTVFGQTEFGARSASALAATLAALSAMWFGRRWFGAAGGLAAGLMQATLPLLWSPGRTAEIEALNNLGTQLAGLGMIDLALGSAAGRTAIERLKLTAAAAGESAASAMRIGPAEENNSVGGFGATWSIALVVMLGLLIAGLAKGPASAAVIGGVLIGCGVAARNSRFRLPLALIVALVGAALALALIGAEVVKANRGAITQGSTEFLWSDGVAKVLMLGPMALFSAMPASIAIFFVFGRDARAEAAASGSNATRRAYLASLMLAWSWVCAIAIMTAIGVGNPRYAMPAAFGFPMLCGWVVRGVWGVRASFGDQRRGLAKRLTFKNPFSWPVVLTVASVLTAGVASFGKEFRVGVGGGSDQIGAALGKALPDGAVVWADGLVEARPDVLLYARRAHGGKLRPTWAKAEMSKGAMPPPGAFIVLRSDAESDERERYRAAIAGQTLELVSEHELGKYKFGVYRAR